MYISCNRRLGYCWLYRIVLKLNCFWTCFRLVYRSLLLWMFLAYHSCEFVKVDVKGYVRVWNYDDALPVNSFRNHKLSDRGLSKLLLINELDESLLLAASSDGNVRVWKNFTQKGGQKFVTAFSSVQGHRAAGRSIVIDWQQQSGYLYASGNMSSILVWDLDKEQLLSTIQSSADSAISALLLKKLWACLLRVYNVPFSIIYGITDCKCISSWRHSVSRC
ncbi:regulatory-associated protein of TOR 1-like isoform X2 [Panicum virgatum]|uniref:regulatory-associated protein of TOR 1-like isoform X2 n=1 Tax=Panicum virgatum TaxID=38727 RepID=UPI0019D58D8B|nr:regulatory-associated protein of TOR 1-like isoform X2 [Panicum virgatum]